MRAPTAFRRQETAIPCFRVFFLLTVIFLSAVFVFPDFGLISGADAAAETQDAWSVCEGNANDWVYREGTGYPEPGGSVLLPAAPYEVFRYTGKVRTGCNLFTALDGNYDVICFSGGESRDGDGERFICPCGTEYLLVTPGQAMGEGAAVWKRNTSLSMSVMGDSISTYIKYIPPENEEYYDGNTAGVFSAADMWWTLVSEEAGYRISTVEAWSGTRVTTLAGEDEAMCMDRTGRLSGASEPDIILIFAGMNDFLQGSPLGTWNRKTDIPVSGRTFREAYALMLYKIRRNYPMARIYCCTLTPCERDLKIGNLEKLHKQYLHEFNSAIRETAQMFDCRIIDLNACGINSYNMNVYMGDYTAADGAGLHPNAAGQRLIADTVLRVLRQWEN